MPSLIANCEDCNSQVGYAIAERTLEIYGKILCVKCVDVLAKEKLDRIKAEEAAKEMTCVIQDEA
jgi:hypothetical protein